MSYVYDYSKLTGRLKEKHLTQSDLANKIGLSETSLNLSLNNKRPFKQSEISRICKCLKIPVRKIDAYFFTRKL